MFEFNLCSASDWDLIFSNSCSVLSDSGKRVDKRENRREVAKNISPGLVVYSLTMVARALKGLAMPLVKEKILVFTRVGNSLPLA